MGKEKSFHLRREEIKNGFLPAEREKNERKKCLS